MTFQQLQISEGNITFQNCRINVKAWPQESLKADEAQSTRSWKRRGGWSVQFPKWSWWILLLQSKSWPAIFQKDIITRCEWIIDPKQWQSDSSRISSGVGRRVPTWISVLGQRRWRLRQASSSITDHLMMVNSPAAPIIQKKDEPSQKQGKRIIEHCSPSNYSVGN